MPPNSLRNHTPNGKSGRPADKPYYTITSLQKGFAVLELLARKGALGASDVARELGHHRSVANRFLATLRDLGYVAQDSRARYQLTLKMFCLGNLVCNQLEIRSMARPLMRRIVEKHKESVSLACLEKHEVVVVEMINTSHPLKYDLPIGSRGPAHAQALGKAMLAWASPEDLAGYLDKTKLRKLTPNTIDNREDLLRHLEQVRARGYALDREEWNQGLRCVAVPIFDHQQRPVFALSLSGPSHRMTEQKITGALPDLQETADQVSIILGAVE